MSATRKANFRVVVEPRRLGDYGGVSVSDWFFNDSLEEIERKYEQRCKEIVADIRRHVDDVASVRVEFDSVCIHCGIDPEPVNGVPQCCEAAQEATDD